MLQCVAVCCIVLQRVAACCRVLQCIAVCCSVLQCIAVCCSVLQCVVVCCSVLQCVAACCSVLQCAVVHCSVLYGVAARHLHKYDQATTHRGMFSVQKRLSWYTKGAYLSISYVSISYLSISYLSSIEKRRIQYTKETRQLHKKAYLLYKVARHDQGSVTRALNLYKRPIHVLK